MAARSRTLIAGCIIEYIWKPFKEQDNGFNCTSTIDFSNILTGWILMWQLTVTVLPLCLQMVMCPGHVAKGTSHWPNG